MAIDAGLLEQMLIGALLALSVYLPLRCGQRHVRFQLHKRVFRAAHRRHHGHRG